jgi:hypothetical protein
MVGFTAPRVHRELDPPSTSFGVGELGPHDPQLTASSHVFDHIDAGGSHAVPVDVPIPLQVTEESSALGLGQRLPQRRRAGTESIHHLAPVNPTQSLGSDLGPHSLQ